MHKLTMTAMREASAFHSAWQQSPTSCRLEAESLKLTIWTDGCKRKTETQIFSLICLD